MNNTLNIALSLIVLALCATCDSLYIINPNNCVVNPSVCVGGTVCNRKTKHCDPIFVLGQPDELTVSNLTFGLTGPSGVLLVNDQGASGQLKLVVADYQNNRVLIWNRVPRSPSERTAPDVVLGQPDFSTRTQNYGGLSGKTMALPKSVASDGQRLLVGDDNNHRVLIWNSIPTTSSAAADQVWGQPNFTTRAASTNPPTAAQTESAQLFSTSGSGLALSDLGLRRVLYFKSIPNSATVTPDFVFGPPDFITKLGATFAPIGVPWTDGSRLYVADAQTDRVLRFNFPASLMSGVPLASATAYGTRCAATGPISDGCFNNPTGVTSTSVDCNNDTCLWIVDSSNSRVVRFPTLGGTSRLVLGQADSTKNAAAMPPNLATMNQPEGISVAGTRMAVADTGNNRVLLWNDLPKTTGQAADVVIGQPDGMTSVANAPDEISGQRMNSVSAVTGDANHLIVADTSFHRVLIWNHIPLNRGTAPDVVLGQKDLVSSLPNGGSSSATKTGLSSPSCVHLEDGHLVVADQGNHRVLIWNQIPTENNSPADLVIGQLDFATTRAVTPVSASTLNRPGWAVLHGGRLFVADSMNNRVLLYNNPYQMSAGLSADLVLGQTTMSVNTANAGGLSESTLKNPGGVVTDGTNLVISDTGNNRVLIWNSVPNTSGAAANLVLGQPNFGSAAAPTPPGPASLFSPTGLLLYGPMLFVVDRGNHRILYWRTFSQGNAIPADGVLGQIDLRVGIQNNHFLPPLGRLSLPEGLWMNEDRLFIADTGNSRVVVTAHPN